MRRPTSLLKLLSILLLGTVFSGCGSETSDGNLFQNGDQSQALEQPQQEQQPDANVVDTPVIDSYKAVIEWDIPSTRENGDELLMSEIGGYEIIYRKTSDQEFVTVVIEDPSVSEYSVTDLSAGEYEVRIAAFDTDGLYSDYSDAAVAPIGI